MTEARKTGRRDALRAAVTVLVATPSLVTALAPLIGGRAGRWSKIAGAADLRPEAPVRFTYEVRAGWETRREAGFVLRRGEEIVAFRARCTHAGCRLQAEGDEFRCPCHGGAFDLAGRPLRGPVTEPLEELEIRVEEGAVLARPR